MKEGYINLVFIIDESGSMGGSESDVVGGFNKLVEEQKLVEDGQCTVSMFTFNGDVKERFIGKDVCEVKKLEVGRGFWFSNSISVSSCIIDGVADIKVKEESYGTDPLYQYIPGGMTAMNDGIGTAIDRIGKWLANMPEEERPSKNLVVIMTDGEENSSKEYTLAKVQEMIKHQTEVYDWSFVYMGMDITSKDAAESLGINNRSYTSKSSDSLTKSWSNITNSATCYRCCDSAIDASEVMNSYLNAELTADTKLYETQTGIKIEDN